MNNQVKELLAKKETLEKRLGELEKQIKDLNQVHKFQKGTVDAEGFPRADLDFGEFGNYRNLKREKAELNNDHFAVMKQLEKHLYKLHESFPDIDPEQQEVKPKEQPHKAEVPKPKQQDHKMVQEKPHNIDYLTPFARISIVDEGSPSHHAGLQVGDLLSEFSEVNIYSIDFLKEIPKHVHEGKPIKLVVLRRLTEKKEGDNIFVLKDGNAYEKIALEITPAKWEGKGMLGCKIDPLHSS